jgi:anaerobic selenocysteine-containing dehydrogenase
MFEPSVPFVCGGCDLYCGLLAQVNVERNKIVRITANPDHPSMPGSICRIGERGMDFVEHPDRLRHPIRRVGGRGSGKWERISWEEALAGIAERMQRIIDEDGPEAIATSIGAGGPMPHDMSRRFMNLLGSPNWTSPLLVCMGNTASIDRITYGWHQVADYEGTGCVVLWGHDPQPKKWVGEYLALKDARRAGARLIVVDPFESLNARSADVWLQLRPGTDAALALGWLNVIIEEELYDCDFVANWTVGFERLKARARDFSPGRVAQITGVSANQIRSAARLYATTHPAIIPWGCTLDMQTNSTNALRTLGILRAVCGNLDVPGGEVLYGYHPHIRSCAEMELNELMPTEQKAKQLGADRFKVLAWDCFDLTSAAMEPVWGRPYANQCAGGTIAHAPSIWRAMATGDPYRVRGFIADGNNTLMSYPNTRAIYEGLTNLDLLVVMDFFMTPTAQIADFVLPAATWLERPALDAGDDSTCSYYSGDQVLEPPPDCWTDYRFYRELATRLGQEEYWPWPDLEELYDYRLEPLGVTFREFVAEHLVHCPELEFKKYADSGFGTPSGKVELHSSILERLGYDPLPGYQEPPESPVSTPCVHDDYPLIYFIGQRDHPFYLTAGRQITALRNLEPEPGLRMHPDTARRNGLDEGEWVYLETRIGRIRLRAEFDEAAHPDVVCVPHGWWFPELAEGEPGLSGLWESNSAVLLADSDEHCDPAQGLPQLRGMLCRIRPESHGPTRGRAAWVHESEVGGETFNPRASS